MIKWSSGLKYSVFSHVEADLARQELPGLTKRFLIGKGTDLGEEVYEDFMMMMSLTLTRATKRGYIMLCVGQGGSGKSSIL